MEKVRRNEDSFIKERKDEQVVMNKDNLISSTTFKQIHVL